MPLRADVSDIFLHLNTNMTDKKNTHTGNIETDELNISVLRITALWAFSESAFGGILHALTVPLRGLFIASAAVLFISLIALFANNSREILKSTLIVLLIKAAVSPYTPLTAYLAVSIQGLAGFLLFPTKKYFRISAFLLGVLVLLLSGVQKIIILTILFGNTLWESVDIFIKQVSTEIFKINQPGINYGYAIVAIYVLLHISAGVFIGLYAGRLPQKIDHYKSRIPALIENKTGKYFPQKEKRKKKSWFLRPTGILIIALSAGVILLSYITPESEKTAATAVIIMLIRAVSITFVWYVLLGPVIKKLFQKFLAGRRSGYSGDIEKVVSMFPEFKKTVGYCWKLSNGKTGYKRIRFFLSTTFYYLLLTE